jgi:3-isopropylmalate dehydratase small subunit
MAENFLSGRLWIFGDNVDTDTIYPGRYLHLLDKAEMADHAFEFARPEFVKSVQPNDIILAGRNFGCGSSREHAVFCLKQNGIGAVIARSYARIFYRNAINNGIPALSFSEDDSKIEALFASASDGSDAVLDFNENSFKLLSSGQSVKIQPLPDHLQQIINSGGLIEFLKSEFKK